MATLDTATCVSSHEVLLRLLLLCYQALNFCSFDVYSKALSGVMSDGSNSARFLAGAMAGVRGSGDQISGASALCGLNQQGFVRHGLNMMCNRQSLKFRIGSTEGLQGARSWLGYNQQAPQSSSPLIFHVTCITCCCNLTLHQAVNKAC